MKESFLGNPRLPGPNLLAYTLLSELLGRPGKDRKTRKGQGRPGAQGPRRGPGKTRRRLREGQDRPRTGPGKARRGTG